MNSLLLVSLSLSSAFASPLVISPFSQFFSGNIIEQTRAQADNAKTVLRTMASHKKAAPYIQRVIDSSDCLDNIDDTIETIEESVKLVEKNGPAILKLVATVKSLNDEKDITKLVRSSAEMLRILEVLIPNITEEPSRVCNTSPAERIEAFKAIAKLMEDVLNEYEIQLLNINRQQLKLSSKIISEMAAFLDTLTKSLKSFDDVICSEDKAYNIALYNTIGGIMESLAAFFEALGGAETAKDIRSKDVFLKRIADAFVDLDLDINSSQDCGTYGSYTALAQTLEDLADIVDDTGLEKLSKELGINLDLN